MTKAITAWLVGALTATVVSCGSSSTGTGTSGGNTGGSSVGGAGGGTGGSGGAAGSDGGPACYNCGQVVLGMKMPSDVCPSSMAIYMKFVDCTCTGKCMTSCTGVCTDPDGGTSQECAACVLQPGDQGCGDELAACTADM